MRQEQDSRWPDFLTRTRKYYFICVSTSVIQNNLNHFPLLQRDITS